MSYSPATAGGVTYGPFGDAYSGDAVTIALTGSGTASLATVSAPVWADTDGNIIEPGVYRLWLVVLSQAAPAVAGGHLIAGDPINAGYEYLPLDPVADPDSMGEGNIVFGTFALTEADLPYMPTSQVFSLTPDATAAVRCSLTVARVTH